MVFEVTKIPSDEGLRVREWKWAAFIMQKIKYSNSAALVFNSFWFFPSRRFRCSTPRFLSLNSLSPHLNLSLSWSSRRAREESSPVSELRYQLYYSCFMLCLADLDLVICFMFHSIAFLCSLFGAEFIFRVNLRFELIVMWIVGDSESFYVEIDVFLQFMRICDLSLLENCEKCYSSSTYFLTEVIEYCSVVRMFWSRRSCGFEPVLFSYFG